MKTSIIFLVVIILFIGCKQDESTMMPKTDSSNFTISPSDNQSSVSQTTSIVLSFAKTVDKSIVEKNFRLINTLAYIDSLCPISKTMGHNSMMMVMNDSMNMNHVDSIHALRGKFYWSSDDKTCTFMPDSLLRPGMQHMVHLREEMTSMMEQQMGSLGMMGRTGLGNTMGMTFHFTTKSTDSIGGHDSHHP